MNYHEKAIRPDIRFEGFTDDWEQRKLGEVVEDYIEKTTVEDQYPVLTSSQQKGIVLQDEYFSGERVSQNGNIGYFVIPRGYFAFRSRSDNDVFVFNRNDAVDMGIISYFYPVFKPKGVDSDFLLRRLNYGLEDQIKINSEGTGQHVLSLKKFKNMIGDFPSYKEQQKIGAYFKQLDNLITLHQRKYDALKEAKKYYLQNMFPQKGEKVPRIRFEGFTGEWEQRKLGEEAIEILAGGDIDKERTVDDGKYPIYANALTNDGIVGYYENYYRVKAPAVTVTGRGEVGHAQARMIDFTPVVRLLAIRSKHDCYFLENAINNHKVVVESTGVPQLTVPQLSAYEIFFPQNIEEEIKIGEYFAGLDNLITLHQHKCEALKEAKKFFLQKMFP